MAISEKSVADSTLMAIEEINEQGGVLGKRIRPIVVDGRSDGPTFAREAEHLIVDEKVSVVFGCWTSASRKTVKPVFEKYNHLLFYPVQYEGLEQSPNIVYTGAAPNQQIIPAVKWTYDNLGKRIFLVGSDQVFAHSANAIIKDQVAALKGEIVGEEYLLLGSKDVKAVVEKIVQSKPTVILNTISGDSNVAFFSELRRAGITPDKTPTMSFSIAEEELRSMNVKDLVGDYASRNYFQSQTNPENLEFVKRFKAKYGPERATDDPIEAAYFGVHVWAQAARAAGSVNVDSVRAAIPNQNYNAPEGPVFIDAENNHTWRTVRIGKIAEDGQFSIVWDSQRPLRPVPYPIYRTKAEWEKFLTDLFVGWKQHWANPGPGPG
jgi:urea transport system substrate-binding protein